MVKSARFKTRKPAVSADLKIRKMNPLNPEDFMEVTDYRDTLAENVEATEDDIPDREEEEILHRTSPDGRYGRFR